MGLNKRLTAIQTLLSFHGRIGRLRFLGFNILVGIVFVPILLFAAVSSQEYAALGKSSGALEIFFFLPWLCSFWCGSALMAKRLHDLDRSGLHAIWICALWYAPFSLQTQYIAFALQLAALTASFWLILWPGNSGPNVYGLKTGMTVDRTPDGALHAV